METAGEALAVIMAMILVLILGLMVVDALLPKGVFSRIAQFFLKKLSIR